MKQIAVLFSAGLLASVILQGVGSFSVAAESVVAPAEKTAAWESLPAASWRPFRGKDDAALPKMWTVEADGSLHHSPGDGSWRGGDLVSKDAYENFEWEVEWKVSKAANSGLFYRVDESGSARIFDRCFEYQVLDDIGFHNGKAPNEHRTGALYDNIPAPAEKPLKAVGEWNTTRIVVKGQKIEHWLNGTLLLSADLESPEYKEKNARKQGARGKLNNGRLGLQDHGGEVWYRNIRVRRIDAK